MQGKKEKRRDIALPHMNLRANDCNRSSDVDLDIRAIRFQWTEIFCDQMRTGFVRRCAEVPSAMTDMGFSELPAGALTTNGTSTGCFPLLRPRAIRDS
jgi:hypothetical protein